MGDNRRVGGIEMNPIFVVATEADVWSTSARDWLAGVRLEDLQRELRPGQHVYLVHLDTMAADGVVKLTELTGPT